LGGEGNNYVTGMSVYNEELVAVVGYTIPSIDQFNPLLLVGVIGVVVHLIVIIVYKKK
jgi:hypothetical protein